MPHDDSEVGEHSMDLKVGDDVSGDDARSSLPVFPGSSSKAIHLLTKHFRGASESAARNLYHVDAVVSPVPIVTHNVTLCSIRPAARVVLLGVLTRR
jgi:hypothetical protein